METSASAHFTGLQAFRELEWEGWESVAVHYATCFGDLTSQAAEPLLRAVGDGSGMRLLDVATGPGYVAAMAAERGARAVGVDFAPAMVEHARSLYPHVAFKEGDAEDLPFPDASFDAVTINFGLLHVSRPEQALVEAYRVLRPGGRIGFTVWAKPDKALGFGIVLGAIETFGNLNVPMPPAPPFFRYSDPAESSNCLLQSGFTDPRVEIIPQVWRLSSPDLLFESMWAASVRTAAILRAQKSEALTGIRNAVTAAAAAHERDGMIEIPMPAVLAWAVKP